MTEFLGLKDIENLNDLQNGIMFVPTTVWTKNETGVLVSGIAGYSVFDNEGPLNVAECESCARLESHVGAWISEPS